MVSVVGTLSKKICLLGDFSVGKTSLVRRFVYDLFDQKYMSTIGVKVSRKSLAVPLGENAIVELTILLWDLAGGEDFNFMQSAYLRGAAGAILVCDLTRPNTLFHLASYTEDLRAEAPEARCVLAANKTDITGEAAISEAQVAAFAKQVQAPYYLTSAKTGAGVATLFRDFAQSLVEGYAPIS